jgi:mono/diheme cytochrome c family protein
MRLLVSLLLAAAVLPAAAQEKQKTDPSIARGRYIVGIAGCNDCHTPNFPASGGKTPEKDWLTGDALGWRGPWGTTYATNLRLVMPAMTQKQWLAHARTMEPRPPMPWFNVRAMSEQDLVAIYAFVKSLGPAGEPAPAYIPPGEVPAGPHVRFMQ